MALMRRLLEDAHSKLRQMMQENPPRTDEEAQAMVQATTENGTPNELDGALDSPATDVILPDSTIASPKRSPPPHVVNGYSSEKQECKKPSEMRLVLPDAAKIGSDISEELAEKLNQVLQDNLRLEEEKKTLEEKLSTLDNEQNSTKQVNQLEDELKNAKEALIALKQDRKRLKAEKFDLLNQMKQLYGTLEDKEKELRDFIRNYEQKIRESDESVKQLMSERESIEREKWNILKHAQSEADRSVALCAQLGIKEAHIRQLQDELNSSRERCGYTSDAESRIGLYRTNGFHSPTHSSNGTPLGSDGLGTPTIAIEASPSHHQIPPTPPDMRPSLTGLSRSAEEIYNSSGGSDCSSATKKKEKRKEKGTWGTISRVFSRNRNRKALDSAIYTDSDQRSSWSPQSSVCGTSPLTETSYLEKLRVLEDAQGTPMDRWRAPTVLAWLEISLGMPQYGLHCAENIKSGKVLLELSDAELECGLGITNVMHRRKLRLAIEEHREPSLCLYPKLCLLSHNWVVDEWLPSLGLSCYTENFAMQLVDGRVLDTVTKKDLEKYLGVSRKFHHASILHGVHLLRMVRYDRHLLQQRRSLSENMDVDPLVWTNQRFIKWARSIDLGEYAENLRDSGVHGALVVLESSFNADTLATALGIPSSKNIIRRHLTTELESLIQPARMSLEAEEVVSTKKLERKSLTLTSAVSTNSLGRTFIRSYSRSNTMEPRTSKRTSLRGSLTKALGLRVSQKLKRSPSFQGSFTLGKSPSAENYDKKHIYHTLTVTPV